MKLPKVNSEEMRKYTRMQRKLLALTQEELGVSVGLSASKLSLYESGLIDLTADEVRRIDKFLNKLSRGNMVKLSDLGRLGSAEDFDALWNKKPSVNEKTQKRFFRQSAGLTQRQLARKARIPRNKLIKFESGKIDLTNEETARWWQAIRDAANAKKQEDPYRQIEALSEVLKKREEVLKSKDEMIAAKNNIIAAADKIEAISKEIIEELKTEIARLELLNKEISESKDREIQTLREQLEAKKRLVTVPPDETREGTEY
jgi:predicted transcriptional regulator